MRLKNKFVIFCLAAMSFTAVAQTGNPSQERPDTRLSVEECLEMAKQKNASVLNSRLDEEAALAQKREALGEYFPRVSVNALGFYAFDPMLEIGVKDILGNNNFSNNLQSIINSIAGQIGIDPVYTTLKRGVTATVSVTQPIFAGGRIVNGNRLAVLELEAAKLQGGIKHRETSEDVEKSYWQVISLEEKLKTLNQVQSLVDTLYKDVSSAYKAGLATENDLLQVKLKQNEVRSGKIRVKNGIRLAKMNLFNSIGQPYTPYTTMSNEEIPYIDDITLTDRLDELKSPEECYRPEEEIAASQEETRLLDLSVRSKQLEKKMVLGETLPQIAVGASYGYGNLLNKGSFNGAVYAMVQIPLSDWGKTARKLQRYDTQIQKAENEKEYLNAQIILQIRQLWLDLTSSWEQLMVARESMETSASSVRQTEAHYKAGLSPLSELLQAQTQYRQGSDQYIDQCIAYKNAMTAYLHRSGEKD